MYVLNFARPATWRNFIFLDIFKDFSGADRYSSLKVSPCIKEAV